MDERRGPDYAHNLTARERAMLARVLSKVAVQLEVQPAAPPRRSSRRSSRSWLRQPLFAAAAAVLILFAAGALHTPSSGPPPVMTLAPAAQPAQLLHQLADRAAGAAPRDGLQQNRQEIVVYTQPSFCAIDSMLVQIGTSPAVSWPQAQPAKLSITGAGVPAGVGALAGCSHPTLRRAGENVEPHNLSTTDLGTQLGQLIGSDSDFHTLPPYSDARALDGRKNLAEVEASPDGVTQAIDSMLAPGPFGDTFGVAYWWQLWTELVSSPLCSPQLRAAALRAGAQRAAASGEVTVAPFDTADGSIDLRGQTGITLQVPGLVDTMDTIVELTFDVVRGELTQRVTVIGDSPKERRNITLYLPDGLADFATPMPTRYDAP